MALSEDFVSFFPITSNNTGGTSLAVDSRGGVHAALSAKTAMDGSRPAYYGYCPSACHVPGNWTWTAVGELGLAGGSARVAIDPQDRPRMMWVYEAGISGDPTYVYAECDAACTTAANWQAYGVLAATDIADFTDGTQAGAYFALDPEGRPRFIYRDINAYEEHTGTWYAFCDGDCLEANWYEDRITPSVMSEPSLVIGADGEPSIAMRADGAVWYVETTWWSGARLYNLGLDAAFSLALDAQGRPRLALYTGFYDTDDPDNDLLALATCDEQCVAGENWTLQFMGMPEGWGQYPALVYDDQDRPHLAFAVEDFTSSVYGLAYARCIGDCDTEEASWGLEIVDDVDHVEREFPVPPSGSCTSLWSDVGTRASLALDATGKPYIGYDAVHFQGITCSPAREDLRLARLAVGGLGSVSPTATPETPTPETPTPQTPTPVTPTPVTVTPQPPGQGERVHLPLVRKR